MNIEIREKGIIYGGDLVKVDRKGDFCISHHFGRICSGFVILGYR
jgi:hypothetical protein